MTPNEVVAELTVRTICVRASLTTLLDVAGNSIKPAWLPRSALSV